MYSLFDLAVLIVPDLAPQSQTTIDPVWRLPRHVRAALIELRRGIIEELRAEEIEDEARALRRRARLRQVRAIEAMTGVPPSDAKSGRRRGA